MGSSIEINDTLQLNQQQGFPCDVLNLQRHRQNPVTVDQLREKVFAFHEKSGARLFHPDPVRVFLVENIDGKWLFWGHALIQSQTIEKQFEIDGSWIEGNWKTSGTYRISRIFDPEYQQQYTRGESPPGRGYF